MLIWVILLAVTMALVLHVLCAFVGCDIVVHTQHPFQEYYDDAFSNVDGTCGGRGLPSIT